MAGVNPYAAGSDSPASLRKDSFQHPAQLTSELLRIHPHSLTHPRTTPLISDKLYSGFVEHLGRGIYGGIVDDPKRPSPASILEKQDKGDDRTKGRLAWRKDVAKILSSDGELEMPILRWPGGNFVSNYHWQDGIGPISQRPKRVELAWLSTETNHFGTDEFIDYCRELKVEPYFCINMGTGTYEEALAWLEYCNGTGDTYWANLRRKNTGRDEPHNVKLWGLGNEMHGPWQVGFLNATDYTKMAKRWAHGMKLVDPSIKLVSCGNQGNSEWDREVLNGLIGVVDYHSIHLYSMLGHEHYSTLSGFEYEKNVFGPAAAERGIEICASLIDLAKIDKASSLLDWNNRDQKVAARDIKICYDEWNVWDEVKAPGSQGLEQAYDYTDMIGVVAWLNILVRKSKDVGIACIAQSVNVISPLMTSSDGLLFQTTYWPLRLFARYMKNGRLLNLGFTPDAYEGPTYPEWIQHLSKPAYVDCVAVLVQDQGGKKASIRLSVLNRHPTADWNGEIHFDGFRIDNVESHVLYHDDLLAKNTFEQPNVVVPQVTKFSGKEWTKQAPQPVRKHSWSFFIFDGTVL
ncbi:Alpha-L-arabinofuranosidase, C-terminal [Kalmanozyma brasiliensis GHG001]|uniref:non-reducing end alpha-L-arabinofuranosidase n=1 Tax=Kalmanozyma brasiliensis (strain GHG001) TaxID=1365824 RepID=V5EQ37_KALBG|nr:Alpha-L-arabinofuranosidase, C-terminal [Kalmanozyma brasiliensis GHG001]EST07240.1 Alpha-L-arabinofuranosidase, C-terminal [Kalmanozyma brasiliensis GHG001]